eukprot:1161645-Pelagomonas_calceolata.AAC.19
MPPGQKPVKGSERGKRNRQKHEKASRPPFQLPMLFFSSAVIMPFSQEFCHDVILPFRHGVVMPS